MCSGGAWSQCHFRHCWSSDHVTGATRSILCKRYGSEVVRVLSQWSNTNLTGQGSTISPSDSRLQCIAGIVLGPQKFTAYTKDLANFIDDHHLDHHMHADDTQLIKYTTASDIPNAFIKLQNCVEAVQEWCRSWRLQLNPAKTELTWFGSKASSKKTVNFDLNLYILELTS